MQPISLDNINVDVVQKDIKHLHLSVYQHAARVTIAAPTRMNIDTIRHINTGFDTEQQA